MISILRIFLFQAVQKMLGHETLSKHTDLSLQLLSKGIQVQIFKTFWIFQDLLQSSGWVGVFGRFIVLEGVHCHLASPLISLRVDTRSIQNLDVGVRTVRNVKTALITTLSDNARFSTIGNMRMV